MRNKKSCGFTIVELMVCALISSILAITCGAMLYQIFLSWHRNSDAVELQRDATVAMDMLSRRIRPSSSLDIQAAGSTLTIGSRSFSLNAGTLWYDPDTGVAGDEVEIIRNTVTSLTFTEDTTLRSVNINMVLSDGITSISLVTSIAYRT